ncbi:methyltransferase domain protein [Blastomonas sp. RAC04]|uniref:class I SAM-dependent methyltransferase n=1 Tax=Blastomonas sp. RAC04 TaxID=1842535 RepID=UPI00083DE19D|nr:class I SAM-dependent methyltransferase [Blastomonas sp. RAC04]AOG01999.1 methyltransferase domain protein [Blastomonas sp. RAC04]
MVEAHPATCPLCASLGKPVLEQVQDYYFHCPGQWTILQCQSGTCGVAWIDPAPSEELLSLAYSTYYTHEEPADSPLKAQVKQLIVKLALAAPQGLLSRRDLTGQLRLVEDAFCNIGAMRPLPRGTILDVGAGNGNRLDVLLRAGWGKAIGVEIDSKAVEAARAQGRQVDTGTADAIPLSDGSVDAAIMHHVIEHVPDPGEALREIGRVLVRGTGRLAILTPNFNSLSRLKWAKFWRGVEAPRHLHIFTQASLSRLLQANGFVIETGRCSARSRAWTDAVSGEAAAKAGAPVPATVRAPTDEMGEELLYVARYAG